MIRNKKGFSLIELIMVLGIASVVSFMKFQDLKQDQETTEARIVGEQMKQVGEAVNGYISIRYDKLSTLSSSVGTGTDPGPRTCSASQCEITYQTLINEGLLPSSYSGINAQKSGYKILLKREGTAPNYVINGLVTTTQPWTEGGKTRYDLLGKAMQSAGVDSGMTKSATVASGYSGQWSEQASDYSNITSTGLLAYRVGYDSSMYSVYLRRDGTLPMTGDLNMGNNNISNAKNITASGTGNFGGDINGGHNITAGNNVIAHNGYGNAMKIGGDATGGDYDFVFEPTSNNMVGFFPTDGAAKFTFNFRGDVAVTSPDGGSRAMTVDSLTGNINTKGSLSLNGYAPADYPAGYGGGLSVWDVYTRGGLYVSAAGADHQLSNWVFSVKNDGSVKTTGTITATGNITSSGQIQGQTVVSGGRLTANEFVQINGVAAEGAGCYPNGLQGRSSAGAMLSCTNGIWANASNLQQNSCHWVGNSQGRDFNPHICAVGEYVAGLQFVGHQSNESAYVVQCCK